MKSHSGQLGSKRHILTTGGVARTLPPVMLHELSPAIADTSHLRPPHYSARDAPDIVRPMKIDRRRLFCLAGGFLFANEAWPADEARPAGRAAASGLSLTDKMGKFPIGDPTDPTFAFCGRAVHRGPYCLEHARLANQMTA
ncbi:MAG: GcrA family cell cycle regulator [Terricaulis sp.]